MKQWTAVCVVVCAAAGTASADLKAKDKLAWSKMGPVEQAAGVSFTGIDAGGAYGSPDPTYFIDALGPRVTQAARAAFVAWCVASDNPVVWAACQPDIDTLDTKKALAEIDADKDADPDKREQVRAAIDELAEKLKQHAADVKALLAKDDVYKKMFDIAKQERTAWDARYKANDPGLEVAVAMEDAIVTQSRKAADGCRKKTWDAVKAALPKVPAKSFAAHRRDTDKIDNIFENRINDTFASALLTDPATFPAVNAYVMCWQLQDDHPKDALVALVAAIGDGVYGARGPRTGAITKIFVAGLTPDDRSAKLEFPEPHRPWWGRKPIYQFYRHGVITAIKPSGDKVTLEFEKKKHDELVVSGCHDTNHIQAIHADGTVTYDEVCSSSKMKTFMVGPPPITVDKDTTTGLKPGMIAVAIDNQVILAWPNAKTETPSLVLGQPVK